MGMLSNFKYDVSLCCEVETGLLYFEYTSALKMRQISVA